MRVVLAIEDSELSEAAILAFRRQFAPPGVEVCLVNVVHRMEDYSEASLRFLEASEAWHQGQLRLAQQWITEKEKELQDAGYAASSRVLEGHPREQLVDFAAQWKADLILLGSHGRTGWRRMLLGSVSEAVASHASCPVEIVRVPKPGEAGMG